MIYKKPKALQFGDTVAVVTPSWGGPAAFPRIYEAGIVALKSLGLRVKECAHTRSDDAFLYTHPELRAKDINDAFADEEVKAIIASIGGDDSVRILPYLDPKVIKNNPKIFMGFSDATTMTTYLRQCGLVAFHGPSIMAGFAQWNYQGKEFQEHVKEFFFHPKEKMSYVPFSLYAQGYTSWEDVQTLGQLKKHTLHDGWHWLQGNTKVTGRLFGGCIEVLEFLKSTDYWPAEDTWKDTILFFETSENVPSVEQVKYMLRNYGMQGVFQNISALLFGIARGYSSDATKELEEMIVQVVGQEFGQKELCIVTNMNFGHTDPQWILPVGIRAEVDPMKKTFQLCESPFY